MEKLYTIGGMTQIFNAKSENINKDLIVQGFSIDSRTLKDGEVFFCITGENTDGHNYIQQALEKGAGVIVASPEKIPLELRQRPFSRILVTDPNLALLEWATDLRKQFSGKVIAVTGSNGKTSTKDILAGLCGYLDFKSYATPGNFNNFIGVPLTLLNAPLDAEWWVIEIGTNKFGEVEQLSKIVQPTAGIITNIGESHLEYLKNTKGVALEKSGLFAGMQKGTKVVVPDSLLHLKLIEEQASKAGVKIIKTTQPNNRQDSEGNNKVLLFDQYFETSIQSPLLQKNLILALTILYSEGVPLSKLKQASATLDLSVKGRFQQIEMDRWLLIDDSYNANPSSFQSVLENLQKMYPDRRKTVVCGAMAELGDLSPELHRQVGKSMAANGIENMLGIGGTEIDCFIEGWIDGGGNHENAAHFIDFRELIMDFNADLQEDDVVLVKGSRSSQMERFVEAMNKDRKKVIS
ncbi:MAG: UDP-N-acetylmuramoyl-tripeptide--D-alanyl-D-alanine ligase [SAR324 cluster bacterium]|nr:UDP-N-acetylmuramoyl-tripeptide--D-alanyl-D-alanine ligase [SAR324 cluster bacterium]MBL7035253.1 UDP-N-acetylmuramoyl-tripeptide--D-alanyl-D-alanine ligase [SAR324 cluster bacterium]